MTRHCKRTLVSPTHRRVESSILQCAMLCKTHIVCCLYRAVLCVVASIAAEFAINPADVTVSVNGTNATVTIVSGALLSSAEVARHIAALSAESEVVTLNVTSLVRDTGAWP